MKGGNTVEIKKLMRQRKVPQWKIARHLQMNESVFCKKLRDEPVGTFREQIMQAIEILATDNKQ